MRKPRLPSPRLNPLAARHGQFVRVAGEVHSVLVETNDRPEKIDHVWLEVRAAGAGHLRFALSTCSRQSRIAGFDPRVWLGIVTARWTALPPAGVHTAEPLNYRQIELAQPVDYVPYERVALEKLLVEKARASLLAEAWGELYVRGHAGVHQIHSRRASYAVPEDVVGRDGALQFYFPRGLREMLLFKFAGQP